MRIFNNEKLSHIVAVALLLIAVQVIIFAEYFNIPNRMRESIQNGDVCTQEAKICPDGSTVSRTGPSCEFAECPTSKVGQIDTAGWQTYRNEKYGFEVKYPTGWDVVENNPVDILLISPDLRIEHTKCSPNDCDVPPNDMSILVFPKTPQSNLDAFVNTFEDGWYAHYKLIDPKIVGSKPAIYISDVGAPVESRPLAALFIDIGSDVILLTLDGYTMKDNDVLLAIWDKFLSAFKFIE